MKKFRRIMAVSLLITVLLTTANINAENTSEQGTDNTKTNMVKAEKYTMDLRLNTKKDKLLEIVKIKIKNDTDNNVNVLYFRNIAHSAIKYCKKNYPSKVNRSKKSLIKYVKVEGIGKVSVKYKKDRSVFYIKLGENVIEPGQIKNIRIRTITDIPLRDDRFGYHKNKSGKLYTLSFCYPYLAPNEGGKWNTDPYFDDGETRASEVTDYEVKFTAPSKYKVAASGEYKTKKGVTTIQAKQMRDFAIVACNYMKKNSFKIKGITVNNYYLPGKYQKRYCKISRLVAADTIRILTEKIGKYPYSQLDMVACIFGYSFGGMEYPGLVMNNATAYYGKGTDTAIYDPYSLQEVVTHEIAHQWFFASVGNDEYKEGWLDEGFSTYCERILYGLADTKSMRYVIDKAELKINLKKKQKEYKEMIENEYKNKKANYINIPVNCYSENDLYGEREYDGGSMFLCELELVMGNEKFNNFIKEYYSTFTLKKATTADVITIIQKHDNSEKVNGVIDKYISQEYL